VSETLLTRRGLAGVLSAACLRAGAQPPPCLAIETDIHAVNGAEVVLGKGFHVLAANRAREKAGSVVGLRHVYKSFVRDGERYKLQIRVRGANLQVRLNGMLTVDYTHTEPIPVDEGAVSKWRARPISDPPVAPATLDDTAHRIAEATRRGIPMIDFHTHLKLGLTLEQAVAKSLRDGIQYGVAVNCGKGFPVETDAGAQAFFESLRGAPVFRAMQAEGREWPAMFSKETVRQFDYIFTDSMTWTDNHGKRMRTWIPAEVGTIADPQEFMDTLVDRAVGILETEHVNIYANPTFLPDAIARDYETLWTERRRHRVISAAVKNGVAIEINNRYKLPSKSFIQMAKAAGAKFTFGTNNVGPQDLLRCEYGLQMIHECKLEAKDFWTPS
jgi:hypothetical protein